MKSLMKIIEVSFEMLTQHDWDNVLIITGDEGISKSNLGLHLFEGYYNLLGMTIDEGLMKFIALDMLEFIKGFRELKKFYMLVYDEAGDLSNLRQMNKFNYYVTKSYKVIRGLNLLTVLILPDLFELNPFFTRRRARGLIHVYKRGKAAYWNKQKLRQILDVNKAYKRKSVWRVPPLFRDTFPRYKGVLKPFYDEKKTRKMEAEQDTLYNEIANEYEVDRELELMWRSKHIVGVKDTARIWDVSSRTIYNKLEDFIPLKTAPL